MNAYGTPTLGATPFIVFQGYPGINTNKLYLLEIPNQTGVILCPVPFIKILHSFAGKLRTIDTEARISFSQVLAINDDALFTIVGFRLIGYPASFAFVLFTQKTQAGSAVYPAGSYCQPVKSRGSFGNSRALLVTTHGAIDYAALGGG